MTYGRKNRRAKSMTEVEEAHHVLIKEMFRIITSNEEHRQHMIELFCEESNEFTAAGKHFAAETLRDIMRGRFGIR